MNRTWLVLLGLVLLAAPAAAQDQFNFSTNADNTLTIIEYLGPGGAVTIPTNFNGLQVTAIGINAFAGNTSLTSVTIPDSITTIGNYAFYFCSGLDSVVVPGSVTSIGAAAFYACSGLTNAIMANGVTSIGAEAFQDCDGLGSVVIPGSVASIGQDAFQYCLGLTSVMISNGVTSIGQDAFQFCYALTNAVLPGSITNMDWDVFSYCSNLSTVTIGNGILSIGNGAFFDCTSLTSAAIPDSVTNIGADAYYGCTSLTNASMPNSVASIDAYAFQGCSSLANLEISSNVTNIGYAAFAAESGLTAIMVDPQNSFYSSMDGVLFDKSHTTLMQCPGGLGGSYTIPAGVGSIGDAAFYGCGDLTSLAIPASVTNIGIIPFSACSSLVAITVDAQNLFFSSVDGVLFDKGQTTLVAFPGGLGGSYMIPSGVTNIAATAFYYCAFLQSVTIPASVTSIGDAAFQNCSNLTSVFVQGNAPDDEGLLFMYDPDPIVYYLAGTTGWSSSYSSDPAVLWNPQIQTDDGNFGIQNNQFGFDITGTTNIPTVVEACSDLSSSNWAPLVTLTLTNGLVYFSEPWQSNSAARYYRVSSP